MAETGLLTNDEARAEARRKLGSRSWWILPWVGERSADLSIAIERRFYDGEANADFEVLIGGLPNWRLPCTVAFAHKRRMTAAQLAALCGEAGLPLEVAALERALATQDVVLGIAPGEEASVLAIMGALQAWLDGE